jgi:hypothetical protein
VEKTGNSFSKLVAAYEACGKKGALAARLGFTESQLSKLVRLHGVKLCALFDELDLALVEASYTAALETVLKEKLGR